MKNRSKQSWTNWKVMIGCAWILAGLLLPAQGKALRRTNGAGPGAQPGMVIECPSLALTNGVLPAGTVNLLYSTTIRVSGGTGRYTYRVSAGELPRGMALDLTDGMLYGFPRLQGTFNFSITVMDSNGCTGTGAYMLVIGLGIGPFQAVSNDFDGDGKADLILWKGNENCYWVKRQSSSGFVHLPLGWGLEVLVSFIDGDPDRPLTTGVVPNPLIPDPVEARNSGRRLRIKTTSGVYINVTFADMMSLPSEEVTSTPAQADYDGDGVIDIADFTWATGTWQIHRSSDDNTLALTWGMGGDWPVPADYDGDGKADLAVFRPSTGYWYIWRSSDGTIMSKLWGTDADIPVHGDYDGDGKADLAFWHEADHSWHIFKSSDQTEHTDKWENAKPGALPVPGDYDGDGKMDKALWHPPDGEWRIKQSKTGEWKTETFGTSNDMPVANRKRQ